MWANSSALSRPAAICQQCMRTSVSVLRNWSGTTEKPKKRGKASSAAPAATSSLKQSETEKLQQFKREWDDAYYNKAEPLVSDAVYDSVTQRLAAEAKHADTRSKAVGASPVSALVKVQHGQSMLSLAAVHSMADVETWHQRLQSRLQPLKLQKAAAWVVEPKVDGLAVRLVYKKGKLVLAATRGDGAVGEDVTHNVWGIKGVPHQLAPDSANSALPEEVEVRGEVYLSHEDFNLINQGDGPKFANTRNAASGSLRLLDPAQAAQRKLSFVAYQLLLPNGKSSTATKDLNRKLDTHWGRLQWLTNCGFAVSSDNKLCEDFSEAMKQAKGWMDRRKTLGYDADGVVFKLNDMNLWEALGDAGGDPRWAVALKFPATEAATRLLDIQMQIGKSGAVTPLAILEPITLEGARIQKASLHNVAQVESLGLRIGDMVVVKRSGSVIPQVVSVVKEMRNGSEQPWSAPSKCPGCNQPLTNTNGVLFCGNASCGSQHLKGLQHYAATCLPKFGTAMVKQLVDAGMLQDVADFYKLSKDALVQLEGVRSKKANNLLESVAASKQLPMSKFVTGLGIRSVGPSAAQQLEVKHGSLHALWLAAQEAGKAGSNTPKLDVVTSSVFAYFQQPEAQVLLQELGAAGVACVGGGIRIARSRNKRSAAAKSLKQAPTKESTQIATSTTEPPSTPPAGASSKVPSLAADTTEEPAMTASVASTVQEPTLTETTKRGSLEPASSATPSTEPNTPTAAEPALPTAPSSLETMTSTASTATESASPARDSTEPSIPAAIASTAAEPASSAAPSIEPMQPTASTAPTPSTSTTASAMPPLLSRDEEKLGKAVVPFGSSDGSIIAPAMHVVQGLSTGGRGADWLDRLDSAIEEMKRVEAQVAVLKQALLQMREESQSWTRSRASGVVIEELEDEREAVLQTQNGQASITWQPTSSPPSSPLVSSSQSSSPPSSPALLPPPTSTSSSFPPSRVASSPPPIASSSTPNPPSSSSPFKPASSTRPFSSSAITAASTSPPPPATQIPTAPEPHPQSNLVNPLSHSNSGVLLPQSNLADSRPQSPPTFLATHSSTPAQSAESSSLSPTRAQSAESSSLSPTRAQSAESSSLSPTRAQSAESSSLSPTRAQSAESSSLSPTRAQSAESSSLSPTLAQSAEPPSLSPTLAQSAEPPSLSPTPAQSAEPPSFPPARSVAGTQAAAAGTEAAIQTAAPARKVSARKAAGAAHKGPVPVVSAAPTAQTATLPTTATGGSITTTSPGKSATVAATSAAAGPPSTALKSKLRATAAARAAAAAMTAAAGTSLQVAKAVPTVAGARADSQLPANQVAPGPVDTTPGTAAAAFSDAMQTASTSGALKGKKIAFTGLLDLPRSDLEALVGAAGGMMVKSGHIQLYMLVAGAAATKQDLMHAKRRGAQVVTEAAFLKQFFPDAFKSWKESKQASSPAVGLGAGAPPAPETAFTKSWAQLRSSSAKPSTNVSGLL